MMSEVQGLLNCCHPSEAQDKVRSCQSMIVMRQLSEQHSLSSEDLKEVNDAIGRGDHDGVIRAIQKQSIPLWKCVNEDGDKSKSGNRTLLRKLLEDMVNGNKVVRRLLDSSVTETGENENALDYRIQIDFSSIADENCNQQTHNCVFDLLKFKANRSSLQAEAFQELVKHPVVASLVALKWKKVQKYYAIQSVIFLAFVLFYSFFLIYMFNRPENHKVRFPSTNNDGKEKVAFLKEPVPTDVLLAKFDSGFIFCELAFVLLTAFLTFFELYQAWKLRRQYVKEWENWMEILVLSAAIVTMASKQVLLGASLMSDIVRGVSALGICFAWLELILLIGRYPFKGGDFSIMFYRIIKRLFRYIFALFLMILGHAFAFMVINYGIEKDSFESPWKSFVMTITMALGEFQFEDLYNSFGDDKTSRTFAMFVLVSLILFGTITMINLFTAVIISDLNNLEKDVFVQNLSNMAQCAILAEAILPNKLLKGLRCRAQRNFCVHELSPVSNADCAADRLPANLSPILSDLRHIVKEKKRRNVTQTSRYGR